MVEMIAGVFGLPIKDKHGNTIRIKGMGPNDGPFSVSPDREAELVKKGIARYVELPNADAEHNDVVSADTTAPIGFDEMPPEYIAGGADDEEETAEEFVDLNSLSAKELREMGKDYGLTFKATDKKATMIDAIIAAQIELASSDDAPSFDATEAVE